MEIFAIQYVFRVPSFAICFLIFLVFLTYFFLFYLSVVVKKILKIFVFVSCMDSRFYQRILQNYGFLLQKIWDISNWKFYQNSIVYYFIFIFSIFDIFYTYFTYPNLSKNYEIFCGVLLEGLEILSTNSRNF